MGVPIIEKDELAVPNEKWHEGTYLVGYWGQGESFVFEGNDGHHLCVSRGFLEQIWDGKA